MDDQEKIRVMREFIEHLTGDPLHGLNAKLLLEHIDRGGE